MADEIINFRKLIRSRFMLCDNKNDLSKDEFDMKDIIDEEYERRLEEIEEEQ